MVVAVRCPGIGLRGLAAALAMVALGAASATGDEPPEGASSSHRAGGTLPDPMRPSGMAAPAAIAAGRTTSSPSAVHAPRLQSVLLGRGGARAAVIDGVVLAVGDRLGEARLQSLTERSAVLMDPHGKTTTLLLIPDVNRQDVGALASTASASEPEPGRRPASFRARRVTETPS